MDKPEPRDFKSVLTCVDLVEQQCMVNKNLAYYRMPMPDGITPPNQVCNRVCVCVCVTGCILNIQYNPRVLYKLIYVTLCSSFTMSYFP